MFKPSSKQQKIFDTWERTDNNILINAVAGSGKTTTLLHLLEYCKLDTYAMVKILEKLKSL